MLFIQQQMAVAHTRVCAFYESTLFEIHFTDSGHGWATGTNGCVYRYVKS
jgi:hypothetical protein